MGFLDFKSPARIEFYVSYEKKELAKKYGARWDPEQKTWYKVFIVRAGDYSDLDDEIRTDPIFKVFKAKSFNCWNMLEEYYPEYLQKCVAKFES